MTLVGVPLTLHILNCCISLVDLDIDISAVILLLCLLNLLLVHLRVECVLKWLAAWVDNEIVPHDKSLLLLLLLLDRLADLVCHSLVVDPHILYLELTLILHKTTIGATTTHFYSKLTVIIAVVPSNLLALHHGCVAHVPHRSRSLVDRWDIPSTEDGLCLSWIRHLRSHLVTICLGVLDWAAWLVEKHHVRVIEVDQCIWNVIDEFYFIASRRGSMLGRSHTHVGSCPHAFATDIGWHETLSFGHLGEQFLVIFEAWGVFLRVIVIEVLAVLFDMLEVYLLVWQVWHISCLVDWLIY